MNVRRLTSNDVSVFVDLRYEGITKYPDGFLFTLEEIKRVDLRNVARMLDNGHIFGQFEDDRLIGFVGLNQRRTQTTRHSATLGPFYVTPDYHGSDAAQGLMDALIVTCKDEGILQIDLWVWSGNSRAIAFYERNGFERKGELPRAVILNGQARDDYLLVRQLDC